MSAAASSSSNNVDAASSTPQYTLDNLAQHTTRDDLWLLIHDKVYDCTAFLDEHPGGDEVMLSEAGKDATESFEDVGHSDEARKQLESLLIGDFKGEKKAKKVARSSSTGTTTQGGSSPVKYLLPLAVIGAYLAWRFYLA